MASLNALLKRRTRTLLRSALGLVLAFIVFTLAQSLEGKGPFTPDDPAPPGQYTVIDVADGDTIYVSMDGIRESIRLVGVDTPETHHPSKPAQCYGTEATQFTRNLVKGKPVKLVADTKQPNRDKYGRLLRYVFLQDGRELNELLVTGGYAFVTNFNTEKKKEFRQLQEAAKNSRTGLWGACTVKESGSYLQTNSVEM
ncbi:thermonuclease family protein [Candidatus Saccharibacteria bacterium]|nr:thermonuclease family protein [Candidatus Saccharibacteria bacterium]